MRVVTKSVEYAWLRSDTMGVGRFVRLSDDAVSLLATGTDCDELHEMILRNPESLDEIAEKEEFFE